MVQVKKIVAAPVPEKGKTVSPNDKERAIAKLLAVKEEIEKGGISFDEAVTLYSQDVRARVSGGLMEPFSTYRSAESSSVPEAVADAAFRLKPGEISTPIETEEGYVILQTVRRIPPKKVLFNDVKETVQRDYLYDSVTGTEIQKWITGLVNSARIEIDAGVLTQFASWGKPGKLKHFETDLIKED